MARSIQNFQLPGGESERILSTFHFANVTFKSEEESDMSIKLNYSKKNKKLPKYYPRSNVGGFQGLEIYRFSRFGYREIKAHLSG